MAARSDPGLSGRQLCSAHPTGQAAWWAGAWVSGVHSGWQGASRCGPSGAWRGAAAGGRRPRDGVPAWGAWRVGASLSWQHAGGGRWCSMQCCWWAACCLRAALDCRRPCAWRRRQLRVVVRQGPGGRAARKLIFGVSRQQAVGMSCMHLAHGHVVGLHMCRTSTLPPTTDEAGLQQESSSALLAVPRTFEEY